MHFAMVVFEVNSLLLCMKKMVTVQKKSKSYLHRSKILFGRSFSTYMLTTKIVRSSASQHYGLVMTIVIFQRIFKSVHKTFLTADSKSLRSHAVDKMSSSEEKEVQFPALKTMKSMK